MASLQLTLLGGFQARIGSGPALPLPTRKTQALLAYLALPPGRAHPRDKLATLLWGDRPEGPARTSLRQALSALRHRPGRATRTDRLAPAPAREASALETPLLGRAVELGRLRQALHEAVTGRGRLVAVVGEAGIGKSRLVAGLASEAIERGARVLLGRCYENEQTLPLAPWVDALRGGQVASDAGALGALNEIWRSELATLLPEVAVPGLPPASQDVVRLFESVTRLIGLLATQEPLVLLFEDLHWADELTVRLLGFLARRTRDSAVLLVVTAREEELAAAPWLRRVL
ncbi:MAG TPA: AAA family ATPase, partial [Methylomirabilota bacterium]|nr:AAA family ATPase [Methylomirabilota bacterium]